MEKAEKADLSVAKKKVMLIHSKLRTFLFLIIYQYVDI
jgi:hypothetical protein